MRRVLIIVIIILSHCLAIGQSAKVPPANFDQAREFGRTSQTISPTSGLYSFDPRVEGEYFFIDFYARRFQGVNWKFELVPGMPAMDCSNHVGTFNIALDMEVVLGGPDYKAKFSEGEFILNESNFKNQSNIAIVTLARDFNVATSGNQLAIAYNAVTTAYPMGGIPDIIEEDKPFYIGTLKFKIKSGLPIGTKSNMLFNVGAGTIGMWAPDDATVMESTKCIVYGFLDGKSIDIPLVPEAESTVPEDPILAGDAKKCPGFQGSYTIGAAKNATGYDWWVTTDALGANKVTDVNIAKITPAADGLSATVDWGTTAAGNTYYVCVQAKNDADEKSNIVSYAVQINALPVLELAVTSGGNTIVSAGPVCGKSDLVLDVKNSDANVTYTWSGGDFTSNKNGAQQTITALSNPTAQQLQTYTVKAVDGDGCEATKDFQVTLNPTPVFVFNPPLQAGYANGKNLQVGVTVTQGGPLTSYDWTVTNPAGSINGTDPTLDFTVQGNTTVAVEVGNNYGCKSSLNHSITANGGITLALDVLYAGTKLCDAYSVLPLQAKVSGLSDGTKYTYEWYQGASATGTPVATVGPTAATENVYAAAATGKYTVKVTTNSDYSATQTFTVEQKILATATSVIVEPVIYAATLSQSVVLLAKPADPTGLYNYKWQPVGKLLAGESEKQYPSTDFLTEETSYQVYMKNNEGCISTGTTVVKMPSASDWQLVAKPRSATLCWGNTQQFSAEILGTATSPKFSWVLSGNPITTYLDNASIANPKLVANNSIGAGVYNYIVKAEAGGKVVTAPVTITISGQTAPALATPDPIYCLESTITLPDVSGLTYHWLITDQATNTTLTATGRGYQFSNAGQYDVRIVGNTTTCHTDTVRLNDLDIRQITLTQNLDKTTYKLGEDITSTATATTGWDSYKYTWSVNALPKLTDVTANTYTVSGASEDKYTFKVSVKDEKGCVATADDKEAVKVAGGLELEVDTMYAYCNNGMAMLQAKVSGGTPDYDYEWTLVGGDGTPLATTSTYLIENPTLDPSAKYQVKVTDKSTPALVRTGVISLSEMKNNNLTAATLTTPGVITVLSGKNAVLLAYATPAETAKCSWNWEPVKHLKTTAEATKQFATTEQITSLRPYKVYMIDENKCISPKADLNVDVKGEADGGFDLLINATDNMCALAIQTLTATCTPAASDGDELEYKWTSMPAGLFSAAEATKPAPFIQPSTAGIYQVALTLKNKTTGITNTAVKSIEVSTDQVPVISIQTTGTQCEGDNLTVMPADPDAVTGIYTWYVDGAEQIGVTGNSLSLNSISGSKTILVTAEGTNGCVGNDEQTVTINARPVIAWTPALPVSVEVGETLTATATSNANYTYDWTGSHAGGTIYNNNAYKVTTVKADKNVVLKVVATDKTTGCKSEPLPGTVAVNGMALECDILADGRACIGGSAVLKATNITGGAAPFKFNWTVKGSNVSLGTDSILVVPVTSATPVEYVVTLATQDDSKKGENSKVVTPENGTVPTVTPCKDITIPLNSKAVLTANATGIKPYSWNWSPVGDLDSPGEATLQSPYTKELTGTTPYKVRVKDAGGCVSPEKDLKVLIKSNDALSVEIVPDMQLCINNHVRYRAVVKDKNGQVVTVTGSEWKAMKGITPVNGDLLAADYNATEAGIDTIVVVVTNGTVTATAKKLITIQPYKVPALVATNAVSCAGDELVLNLNIAGGAEPLKGVYNWSVAKDGGVPVVSSESNGKYTFTDAGSYVVKVFANTQHCTMDTLEKEITIAPIPEIVSVTVDSVCGVAKVVAVTKYADTWNWTNEGVFAGSSVAGKDSIRYYKTTEMKKQFDGVLFARNSVAGCVSTGKNYTGTVYAVPTFTLDPLTTVANPKSVYPNTPVNIEAKNFNPDLAYTLKWYQDGVEMSGKTTKQITTPALAMKSDQYKFAIEVINPENTGCKTSDTTYVAVDNKDFIVSFGKDTLDVCQDVEAQFYVKDENNKYAGLTYILSSNYPGFNATTTDGHFRYTFGQVGKFEVRAEVRNTNGDVRKDTIIVRVNQTPTLNMAQTPGQDYLLCQCNGKLNVDFMATGTAGWKLYYKIDGTKKQEPFTDAAHTMYLTQGGSFVVDSIVDSKGCKATPSRMGFTVIDDIPRIAMTSTDDCTKCKGAETDLNLKITNASDADYPMNLYYWIDNTRQKKFTYANAAAQFASTETGMYTLDSIVSARGCTYRLTADHSITVKEYNEPTPELTLTDIGDKTFCEGGSVTIPLTITEGKPNYTVTYTLNGVEKTAPFTTTTGNITISDNGPFVLKDFADANGCGIFTADQTVTITKNEKPAMEITSTSTQICGGQLDLALKLSKGTAPYTITYTVDGGTDQTEVINTVGADRSTVWAINNQGVYKIKAVADQNCSINGTEITGLGADFTVTPLRLFAKLKTHEGICSTTDAKIDLDFATTTWEDVVGPIRVSYDFTPAGSTTAVSKHADFTKIVAQAGTAQITPVPQGTYVLTGVADQGASGCSGQLSGTDEDHQITVSDAPVVKIDSLDFAVFKGEEFVLGVKDANAADFDYTWQKNNGTFVKSNTPGEGFKWTDVMNNGDIKYVLKGTNKNTPSCFNTDTVNVYKIPETPTIKIDTNHSRKDLILNYEASNPSDIVDGYQIMHNLKDGYGIEKEYTPKVNSISATYYELDEPALDTLEFFYVQAYRNITTAEGTKVYYSTASDTVGYYKYMIGYNPLKSKNNNVVAVYFDPAFYGIEKASDMLKVFDNLSYVRWWSYGEQVWKAVRRVGTTYPNDFDILNGMVLQLEAKEKSAVFLQYGKVPAVYHFELKGMNASKNNNIYFLQPYRIDLKKGSNVLQEIPGSSYVRYWSFEEQVWKAVRRVGTTFPNDFDLKVLMPLQIEMNKNPNSVDWK